MTDADDVGTAGPQVAPAGRFEARRLMLNWMELAHADDVVWLMRALSDDQLVTVLRAARGAFDGRREAVE